jgi:hypothetical protein
MKSVDSLCRAESIVQIGKPSKTIIKVQECFREAYNFLSSGNKKTPITALFSHLKHPFTKVNFLVSNASKDLFLTFSHKPL